MKEARPRAVALASIVVVLSLGSCRPKGASDGATDLDGRTVDPFAAREGTTVLVFVATACPISNRYVPELRRIHDRFGPRGARFFAVYPTATESAEAVRAHVKEMVIPFTALRDPRHVLVARAGVKVTPEVALILPNGEVAYHGRIDDRVVDFGVTRPEPTTHDLEDALDRALAGQRPSTAETTAIGCSISP